eukprot:Rhum_TRINITY_DN14259_c16_g1::Rhum_TRINITY_DN14259_c16_g1_i1::g.78054::m.78054
MSRQPHATARRKLTPRNIRWLRSGSERVVVAAVGGRISPVGNVVSVAERQGVLRVELALEPRAEQGDGTIALSKKGFRLESLGLPDGNVTGELPGGAVADNLCNNARHRRLGKVVVLDAKTKLADGGHILHHHDLAEEGLQLQEHESGTDLLGLHGNDGRRGREVEERHALLDLHRRLPRLFLVHLPLRLPLVLHVRLRLLVLVRVELRLENELLVQHVEVCAVGAVLGDLGNVREDLVAAPQGKVPVALALLDVREHGRVPHGVAHLDVVPDVDHVVRLERVVGLDRRTRRDAVAVLDRLADALRVELPRVERTHHAAALDRAVHAQVSTQVGAVRIQDTDLALLRTEGDQLLSAQREADHLARRQHLLLEDLVPAVRVRRQHVLGDPLARRRAARAVPAAVHEEDGVVPAEQDDKQRDAGDDEVVVPHGLDQLADEGIVLQACHRTHNAPVLMLCPNEVQIL